MRLAKGPARHRYGNSPGMQKMPFVAALTAVIATAAIAGFGPTFLAIGLGSAWSITELLREPRFGTAACAALTEARFGS